MSNLFAIKNSDLKYVDTAQEVATLIGWQSSYDVIGRTDYESPSKIAESADVMVEIDRKVLANGNKLISIETYCYDSGWKTMLYERVPFIRNNQQFIFIRGIDLTPTILAKNFISLAQIDNKKNEAGNGYILSEEYFPYDLTERQKTCLFYLIRGKSFKQIAAILNLATKTVEEHISIVKRKLNCFNKSQLIEKAIDSGFLLCIPKEIINKNS